MKHNNIYIMGTPEGEESEQGIKSLVEEIMTKNFLNMVKEKDTQAHKVQVVPKIHTRRGPPKAHHN